MSDPLLGLLAWLAVAGLTSLAIGRFMRGPRVDGSIEPLPRDSGIDIGLLPGYGQDDASQAEIFNRSDGQSQ